jgi:hypothetical protein
VAKEWFEVMGQIIPFQGRGKKLKKSNALWPKNLDQIVVIVHGHPRAPAFWSQSERGSLTPNPEGGTADFFA